MMNPRSTAPSRLMTEPLCPVPAGCREEIIERHVLDDDFLSEEEPVYGDFDAYDSDEHYYYEDEDHEE